VSEPNESRAKSFNRPDFRHFDRTRQYIYTGLLVFIVVLGLPTVSIPSLRNRLSARIMTLKAAMAGEITPAIIQIGANHEPFPVEYERPEPVVPQMPIVQPKERILTSSTQSLSASSHRSDPKRERLIQSPPPESNSVGLKEALDSEASPSEEAELKYKKGKIEQDAYDLLLKNDPIVAALVQGSNPSLHFKSWDAASRGNDTYWVRLKFQSEGNPESEYIWQVNLQSNEVTPLSYNARNLS
jgi:hypothetical protein